MRWRCVPKQSCPTHCQNSATALLLGQSVTLDISSIHFNIKIYKNINLSKIEHFIFVKHNIRKGTRKKKLFLASFKVYKMLKIYHIRKCKNIANKREIGK